MKIGIPALLFFFLITSHSVFAQSINDLEFMTGYWTGTHEQTIMEEFWTTTEGGVMVGMHKDVRENESTFFEYLRITETDSAIVYFAQPRGNLPTQFTLVEVLVNYAVFENLEHDFPQRIIYHREANQLNVRIENATGEKSIHWKWTISTFK